MTWSEVKARIISGKFDRTHLTRLEEEQIETLKRMTEYHNNSTAHLDYDVPFGLLLYRDFPN